MKPIAARYRHYGRDRVVILEFIEGKDEFAKTGAVVVEADGRVHLSYADFVLDFDRTSEDVSEAFHRLTSERIREQV